MARLHLCAGIFVGGAARRMGGAAKGLLDAGSGETICARLVRLFAAHEVACVLVGERADYASLGLLQLADTHASVGPLGGLVALLRHAQVAEVDAAIAVACDMPYVTPALVARLVTHPLTHPDAKAVAPRRDGRWEPLFARYDVRAALPVAEERAARGALALQGLLDDLGAVELPREAGDDEALRDWDTIDDARSR